MEILANLSLKKHLITFSSVHKFALWAAFYRIVPSFFIIFNDSLEIILEAISVKDFSESRLIN